tara:strand:+ start:522 stop:1082 length:561 start_codon:yes stop_codon:yes gene_type:complete
MSTIINADTSNGLKLTSDTSGEIQLQSAGTTIATVSSTGIAMASGKLLASTGPAFIATPSADQTLSSGTWTAIAFNTEVYDTNSNYNTSTYAFTPTVAGYYNFTAVIRSASTTSRFYTKFLKNGSISYFGNDFNFAANSLNSNYSALIYMNGSTDSVVAQAFIQGGGGLATSAPPMAFSAFLARAA